MLCWLHWFEDTLLWAVITGFCDQKPAQSDNSIMAPSKYWDDIWVDPTYTAFYALGLYTIYFLYFCICIIFVIMKKKGIITWFFGGSYYLVLRLEDFMEKNSSPLSITQGILGMAADGNWDDLEKFLPRMKTISVNRKNILDGGKTAIHYAISQNKWNVVTKLIEFGANVNIMDRSHQSGVHLMCKSKDLDDIDIYRRLLKAFDGDPAVKRDNKGKTILHLICENGTDTLSLEDRLRVYFEIFGGDDKQIDVNIADNNGCVPLHYLVQECNESQALEFLVNAGAKVDIEDNKKRTALIHAVSENENNPTTIRYLLSNGHINHQDDKGWTPLHFAANSTLTDNVFSLLEHFPNVTIRNNAGKNA